VTAAAQLGVALEELVGPALVGRVLDGHRDDLALREARRAVGVGRQLVAQLPLEPPHEHPGQLLGTRVDAAGEALRVEQLEQGGEALPVAVVRGGRQEQAVLAMGATRRMALVRSESTA
jgi:hypothetical protein